MTFAHLASLEIGYSSEELKKYTDFFRRNKNVIRFKILSMADSPLKLEVLTASLDNLEEMIVQYYAEINIDDVTKFMEIHPKLKNFQFTTHAIGEADRETLRERFGQDWHISSIDEENTFLLEKKNEL